jgi:hypothetical protein
MMREMELLVFLAGTFRVAVRARELSMGGRRSGCRVSMHVVGVERAF